MKYLFQFPLPLPLRRILSLFALPLFFLFLISCGSGSSPSPTTPNPPDVPPPPPSQPIVSEIRVQPNSADLPIGAHQQFVAVALDNTGKPVSGVTVSWSLDPPDSEAVSVSQNGEVVGLKVGEVSVIAVFGNDRGGATIRVVQPPPVRPPISSVNVLAPSPSFFVGETPQFAAEAKGADGESIGGVTFSWSSTHPEVLSINNGGQATALKVGSTEITATAEGISSKPMTVTVAERPKAPGITAVTPREGQTVLPTVKPAVSFDQPIDAASLQSGWTLRSGNQTIAGQISCNTPCKTTTLTPSAPLAAGSYTATITSDVRSAQGVAFQGPFSWSFTVSAGNGWRRAGVDGDLFGIHFVSPSEGWTVGINQAIAHTVDGGATWSSQKNLVFSGSTPPTTDVLVDFYDVYFADAKTGWAVGWPEAIFKTTDGGATWVEQHLNRTTWTDRTGDGIWDRRDWCEVWNDAAQTCSKKYGVYLRKVQFFDNQHGWTVGRFGYIFKTANGGASWQEIPQTSAVRPLPAPCTYPADNPNAGQPRPAVTSFNPHLFTVDVITPDEVWIGGGSEGDEPCAVGWLRMLGHTTDGGAHWQFFYEAENGGQLEGHGRIFDLRFSRNADGSAGAVGFAVGGNGTTQANALQTTDGGLTWHQVRAASYPNYTNGYYGLAFIAPSQIWMTGWGGLIVHSENGGTVWSPQQAKTTSQLRRVFFLDANNGWIASQGQVFFTASGGR